MVQGRTSRQKVGSGWGTGKEYFSKCPSRQAVRTQSDEGSEYVLKATASRLWRTPVRDRWLKGDTLIVGDEIVGWRGGGWWFGGCWNGV